MPSSDVALYARKSSIAGVCSRHPSVGARTPSCAAQPKGYAALHGAPLCHLPIRPHGRLSNRTTPCHCRFTRNHCQIHTYDRRVVQGGAAVRSSDGQIGPWHGTSCHRRSFFGRHHCPSADTYRYLDTQIVNHLYALSAPQPTTSQQFPDDAEPDLTRICWTQLLRETEPEMVGPQLPLGPLPDDLSPEQLFL